MSGEFPLKGLRELDAVLSALPKNMQKQAYRQGLTAAAAPVRDEARRIVRKRSGKTAKAIRTGSARQNRDGTFSVTISLKGPHAFVAIFEEYGVAPHYLQAGGGTLSARQLTQSARRAGRLNVAGQYVSGEVFHPGYAAHPFMRPALDAKAEEAVKAFAEKISAFLESKTGFVSPTLAAAQ